MDFWHPDLPATKYIGAGAEQRIFEGDDPAYVIKFNDGIFYAFWEEYCYSLLIHNYLFPHLAYELMGFARKEELLFAVVRQPFVRASEQTNLEHVRSFLQANGFVHIRNNDYRHPELRVILEDLHDENVLTNEGLFYFIDTVFYPSLISSRLKGEYIFQSWMPIFASCSIK